MFSAVYSRISLNKNNALLVRTKLTLQHTLFFFILNDLIVIQNVLICLVKKRNYIYRILGSDCYISISIHCKNLDTSICGLISLICQKIYLNLVINSLTGTIDVNDCTIMCKLMSFIY